MFRKSLLTTTFSVVREELTETFSHYPRRVHGVVFRSHDMEQNLVTTVCRHQITDFCTFCVVQYQWHSRGMTDVVCCPFWDRKRDLIFPGRHCWRFEFFWAVTPCLLVNCETINMKSLRSSETSGFNIRVALNLQGLDSII
jgi:hypothetical protein